MNINNLEDNLKVLSDIGYTVLENKHFRAKDFITVIDKDGYKYGTNYDNLRSGRRPRIADTRNIYSIENIKKWIENNGKQFVLISDEYINKTIPNLRLECKVCGHIWSASWGAMKNRDRGCPSCANNIKFTQDFVSNYFKDNGFELLDEYTGIDKKLNFKDKLGYVYYTNFWIFRKSDCKTMLKFGGTNPNTINNIRLWCKLNNKSFELDDEEYINNTEYMRWKCLNCGHYFYSPWTNIQQNSTCSLCNKSHGEQLIINNLELLSIKYSPQHTFADCKNIRVLPFDFYLPDINTAIEFNGRQHYEPIDFFGGEESFVNRVFLDGIKRNYCIDSGIKILEIPYWEINNISSILKELIRDKEEGE